jgi:hypothetical protein
LDIKQIKTSKLAGKNNFPFMDFPAFLLTANTLVNKKSRNFSEYSRVSDLQHNAFPKLSHKLKNRTRNPLEHGTYESYIPEAPGLDPFSIL